MIAVTKLLEILNKPSLLFWSNKLGLNGTSLNDYYNTVKNEGNTKHNEIELFIKKGVIFDGHEKLKESLESFEIIGVEVDVKNDFLIGRIDLILKKDNLIYVCDFKRNKSIYLNTKIQLSTYKHLYGADKICFINSEDFKIKEININTEKYFEVIKRLFQINQLLTSLNEKL
jgi:hypothetical protein